MTIRLVRYKPYDFLPYCSRRLAYLIIVIPVLFLVTLNVPFWVMTLADRSPARLIQRYVFG